MTKRLRWAWAPTFLLAFGAVFMTADGTSGDERAVAPHVAVAAAERSALSVGTPVTRVALVTNQASATSSRSSSERPFPILPLVGMFLVVMTLALHRSAWRWAH